MAKTSHCNQQLSNSSKTSASVYITCNASEPYITINCNSHYLIFCFTAAWNKSRVEV